VVHGIVSQSGGYVEIQSQVGQGSRFDVYLPVLDDDASPKTEGNAAALASRAPDPDSGGIR
jgi:two-component system, cell cycle sensor histidine kinase and response regulator CckA